MFVALPLQLKNKAKDISPNNERIQTILLETDTGTLMVVNAYFPQDPKTSTDKHDTDLEEILANIENLIENYQCTRVVIAGDFNTDFKRKMEE